MVEFRELKSRKILNKLKYRDNWFWCRYTLNPYRGCQFACNYCDAITEKYLVHKKVEDFSRIIYAKTDAPELLGKEIKKAKRDVIGIGGVTDASNIRETRILACMIDDPGLVTGEQMERWAKDFDYWEICDQCCQNLFEKTKFVHQKAIEWGSSDREFIKRAGFVLMARSAVKDKGTNDKQFEKFLPVIKRGASDNRSHVKKAVNWALRQIGKRNLNLNKMAIKTAREIQGMDSKSAKWIASDTIRELTSGDVQKRLRGQG